MIVPKQRRANRFIGGIKVLAQRSQFYISFLNFLMIMTLYYLRMKEIKVNLFGFILDFSLVPFWFFLLILLIGYVCIMVIDYIYILPSDMSFMVWQQYVHNNPLVNDVRRLEQKVIELEKKVDEIRRVLVHEGVSRSND